MVSLWWPATLVLVTSASNARPSRKLGGIAEPLGHWATQADIPSVKTLAGKLDLAHIALTQAVVAAQLANISIVGLNQCFDIELDHINKPYLPLASGELTPRQGWTIVWLTGVASLAVAAVSLPLTLTVAISLLLGFAYSTDIPGLRWKRFPLLAFGCIFSVRAILVQVGFYHHITQALGLKTQLLAPAVRFPLAFMTFFSLIIALFKDIPDAKGDREFNIRTFTVRLGVERIYGLCIGTLVAMYTMSIGLGLFFAKGAARVAMVSGHALLLGALGRILAGKDYNKHEDLVTVYMNIWKLFYAEYLLIPFAVLGAA